MRTYNELRLLVCKLGAFEVKTRVIYVIDWPDWETAGWQILCVDLDDEIAYAYALDRGHMPLPCMS